MYIDVSFDPASIYLLKVNNRNIEQYVKYLQSKQ